MRYLYLLALLLPCWLSAQEEGLEAFIRSLQVNNYDCLDESKLPQLDSYLSADNLQYGQEFYLKVRKAQALACGGKYEEAADILDRLLATEPERDGSENYAYALYLAGIVTSKDNQAQRCDYYRRAEQEALRVNSESVHLGAQLELSSTCDIDAENIDQSLSKLYSLLERYSRPEDQAIRSDIFNNIGNLYAILGQNELAAEQYFKSYQMSQGVYEGETLITPLFYAVQAYLKSGLLEQARQAIDELIHQNSQINSPLSNAWLNQAQANLALRTGDYQTLRASLVKWSVFLPELSHADMDRTYRLYQARLCLHEQQLRCVQDYLSLELTQYPMEESEDLEYLSLLADSFMALEQYDQAALAFRHYQRAAEQVIESQQGAAKILGVAQMLTDIVQLESSLERAEQEKGQASMRLFIGLGLALALMVLLAWMLYRRQRSFILRDELTGLLNRRASLSKLRTLPRPSVLRVHALALFEINELDEINAEYGDGVGEQALRHLAEILKGATRQGDVVGRMGVNEFLVCLNDIDEIRARSHMERIQRSICQSQIRTADGQRLSLQPDYSLMMLDDAPDDVQSLYQGLAQAVAQSRRLKGELRTG
ncbi:diguanylate cyclase domain-containing protein [Bowmanella dokdonensis]|uniref:diguanylate cyclase n=1 Tax=Bowmanella dokdonensis TaxID=751969 RepID=A0A939DPZ7_9ALTE|nr:diguanylate cyclase [Bowmanella dokdonensis]